MERWGSRRRRRSNDGTPQIKTASNRPGFHTKTVKTKTKSSVRVRICLCAKRLFSALLICTILATLKGAGEERKVGTRQASQARVVGFKDDCGHTAHILNGKNAVCPASRKIMFSDAEENDETKKKKKKAIAQDQWMKVLKMRHDEPEDGDCVLHPWQTTQYPACNLLHELISSPMELYYEAKGSQSVVLSFESSFESHDLVLKTQRYKGKYVDGYTEMGYDRRRQEAMVMERLTSSPYIAPIYGFCAMSVVAPLATHFLFALINSVRNGGDEVSPMDKLRIGVQISEGLAALHGIDATPSFSHNDLDISQYIYYDGIFRLNDFGWGKMLRHNPKNDNVPCKDTSYPLGGAKYRAPEDLESYFITGEPIRLDIADVFSLGTELYMLLTNMWLWEGEEREKSCHRLMKGERPPMLKKLSQSTDKAVQALLKALIMCWEQDPKVRATSREVATFLGGELRRLEGSANSSKVVRVKKLPRIVYGESDYDANI